MTVYKTILGRRTIRLFRNKKIPVKILEKLVNAGRLAPSAKNLQPLEYLIINNEKLCDKVFKNVSFGGETEKLRKKDNRPVAYIFVLVNKKIRSDYFEHDVGLAIENIALSAYEEGIGCCIMGAIDREKLAEIFNIPSDYFLDLIVALGFPAEKPRIEEGKTGHPWRDERGVLHVPKKPLNEILHWNKFKK